MKEKTYDSDFEIYKNFEGVNLESVIMFAGVNYDAVVRYLDNLCKIFVSINGEDLKALGINPGADYQKCFDYIIARKISNPDMTKTDEISLAKEFFGL